MKSKYCRFFLGSNLYEHYCSRVAFCGLIIPKPEQHPAQEYGEKKKLAQRDSNIDPRLTPIDKDHSVVLVFTV